MLRDPDVKTKVLQDELLNMLEHVSKEEVKGLKRYVEVHAINVNNASSYEMLLWVRIVMVFKSRARKSAHQDSRNMLNARVT